MIRSLGALPTFASFNNQGFRMLWLYGVLTSLAMWTMMIGRGWLAFELTGSSAQVGLITLVGRLSFVLAPLGGVLADRLDRRWLLSYTSVASGLLSVALAVISLAGAIEVWNLMALTLLMGVVRAPDRPASDALMASIVPRDTILNATALNRLARFGPEAIGPLLAAPLLVTVGEGFVFLLAAGFYFVTALQILRVQAPAAVVAGKRESFAKDFSEGIGFVVTRPVVATMMILVGFHCALTMSFNAMLPAFAHDVLSGGGLTYGALASALGYGTVVATLAVASLRHERAKGQWLLFAGALSGLATALLAASTSFGMALVAMVSLGLATQTFMTINNAMLLGMLPDSLRGRVSSLYMLMTQGLMAVSMVVMGFLADLSSLNQVFLVAGSAYLGIMLALSVVRPHLRQVYRTGMLAPAVAT